MVTLNKHIHTNSVYVKIVMILFLENYIVSHFLFVEYYSGK